MQSKYFKGLNEEERKSLISAAINRAGVGVIVTDPSQEDNPIIYVNDGFEQLTGYTASEIVGLNCRFLQQGQTSKADRLKIKQAIDEERFINLPLKNFKKDGTPFWNDLNIYPVYIDELDRKYFIGIQRDITEQVEASRLIHKQNDLIERLSLPIIPISKKTAILPLIGEFDAVRQKQLLMEVSEYAASKGKDYMIIDLSGVGRFTSDLFSTVQALSAMLALMGCELVLTGLTPELVMGSKQEFLALTDFPSFATVEQAIRFTSR